MIKQISKLTSKFERDLNVSLMNKEADKPLVDYVIDSIKSLCIIDNIKFLGYEYNEMESEVDKDKYIYKREKNKRKKERFKYKYINDDRVGLLTFHMMLEANEKNPATGKMELHKCPISKSLLIPIRDEEDGCYFLKGKKYYMIYQLVEKSTYTSKNAVILKSLMPFAIRRMAYSKDDIYGDNYTMPIYTIEIFKTDIPIMLFWLCDGVYSALNYVIDYASEVVDFVEEPEEKEVEKNPEDRKFLYFQISKTLYMKVRKKIFDKYPYVQGVVGSILYLSTNRLTMDKLDNTDIWLKKLGNNNINKGEELLRFLNRLIDETTKNRVLKLHKENTRDVNAVIKWMAMEYNELRKKDNMNIYNKRIRCNEYVASLLTQEFSKKLNRVISFGSKATLDLYKEIFKFPGDILIQKMHSSGILKFDDTINDLTFFRNFKYTTKGPHSLGSKNSNSIGLRYRALHPSYIGNIDLTVCSNSDPGTTGILIPFGDIEGLYFDDSYEPENTRLAMIKDIEAILKEEGTEYIGIRYENDEDYYRIMEDITKYTDDINVYASSIEGDNSIILELDNLDETTSNKSSVETEDKSDKE